MIVELWSVMQEHYETWTRSDVEAQKTVTSCASFIMLHNVLMFTADSWPEASLKSLKY